MNKSALISTYNKKNLGLICKILKKFKIQIISTGGTYNIINKLGYQSYKLNDITNFDEILNGRVKSLHPKIHGGILFKRKNKKHNNINSLSTQYYWIILIILLTIEWYLRKKINKFTHSNRKKKELVIE